MLVNYCSQECLKTTDVADVADVTLEFMIEVQFKYVHLLKCSITKRTF